MISLKNIKLALLIFAVSLLGQQVQAANALATSNIFLVVTGVKTFPQGKEKTKKKKGSWKEKLVTKLLSRQLKKKEKQAKQREAEGIKVDPLAKTASITGILAIASLLLAVLISPILFRFAILAGIAAMVLGFISLSRIKKNPEKYSGKGKAWLGILLGAIPVIFLILAIVALSG